MKREATQNQESKASWRGSILRILRETSETIFHYAKAVSKAMLAAFCVLGFFTIFAAWNKSLK